MSKFKKRTDQGFKRYFGSSVMSIRQNQHGNDKGRGTVIWARHHGTYVKAIHGLIGSDKKKGIRV